MNRNLQLAIVAVIVVITIVLVSMVLAKPAVPEAIPTASAAEPVAPDPFQNIVWQWTSVLDQSTGAVTNVTDPGNYTVMFLSDGTLTGKADCNDFTGTYSMQNGFVITLGASSMVACGDTSMDAQYLQLLGSVVAGGPDGMGNFALETAAGVRRMIFTNGGPGR